MTIATCVRGTKSPVSVSDEKVKIQANQDRLFLVFVYISYHKKIVYLLQIYIFSEMVSILKV